MNITTRIVALLLISASATFAAEPPSDAKALFERFVSLGRAFDPAVADLYAGDAKIQNMRTYPTGEKRTLAMSGVEYKNLIRKVMPLAKERGDISRYSEVKYAEEDGRIRITSVRYSELKDYSSAFSLLVGAGEDGKWLIFEETSESKP